MQFSHPLAEQAQGGSPASHGTAYENLFREPEFAPGTALAPVPDPAPARPRRDGRNAPRRTNRRRNAA